MKVSISDLKAHVLGFINRSEHVIDSAVHKAVAEFAEYVEGKQAEIDARAYLEAHGYTVTPPGTGSTAA